MGRGALKYQGISDNHKDNLKIYISPSQKTKINGWFFYIYHLSKLNQDQTSNLKDP